MTQAELKALFLQQQQQQRSGVTLTTEWPSQLPHESFVRYCLLIVRDYLLIPTSDETTHTHTHTHTHILRQGSMI